MESEATQKETPERGDQRLLWEDDSTRRRYEARHGRRKLPTEATLEDAPGDLDNWTSVDDTDIRGLHIYEYQPPKPDHVVNLDDPSIVGRVRDNPDEEAESDDETESEAETLPSILSRKERHLNHVAAGTHPEIEIGDGWRYIISGEEHGHGITVKDGDELIGLVENGRCPVCGDIGSLSVNRTDDWTFMAGAEQRRNKKDDPDWEEGDGTWEYNDELEKLDEKGYHAISCKADSRDYYVGIASPEAYETYSEWAGTKSDRRSFHKEVNALRALDDPHYLYGGKSPSKGAILAAILKELGAVSFDTRDYMDRENVKKGQLLTILDRVKMLDHSEPKRHSEDLWQVMQEQAIESGKVQWHVPEWVGFEGLNYSREKYDTRLFE